MNVQQAYDIGLYIMYEEVGCRGKQKNLFNRIIISTYNFKNIIFVCVYTINECNGNLLFKLKFNIICCFIIKNTKPT